MMINSLCLIPELTCGQNCQYCYEKKKKYGPQLPWAKYVSFAKQYMETLPFLMEVLVDYNGLESVTNLQDLIQPVLLPVTVTTTCQGMERLHALYDMGIQFHLSIHSTEDVIHATELIKKYPGKIASLSVIVNDLEMIPANDPIYDHQVYILMDKFSSFWHDVPAATIYGRVLSRINIKGIKHPSLDNCLLTRINGQECPASSQINLYRDGSIRRCPYEETGQPTQDSDYEKGCKLIGSKE